MKSKMSFNRVTVLPEHACVEAIIDGYEDWGSATDSIVEMTEMAEARKWTRILIDFTRVNLRVALVEAPEVAKFFHSFAARPLQVGVVLPDDERHVGVLQAFADALNAFGHSVTLLRSNHDRETWLSGPQQRAAIA